MGALEEMRESVREKAAKGPRPSKKVWTPPDPARFRHGRVLAFDQTLTNTGVALVVNDHAGLTVAYADLIGPFDRGDLRGFEETYSKAFRCEQVIAWHVSTMMTTSIPPDTIVHEMPSVQGYRTESSLMAGYFVRRAAHHEARGVPVVAIQNQAMRTLLNHPHERYDKKFVKAAVESLIPKERRAKPHVHRWNEHVHDAVALALTHLYQPEEKQ